MTFSHVNIFELFFFFFKYVLGKLFWHLPISASSNCLICLNMFYRTYFRNFAFQHLRIVHFAYLCFKELILASSHYNIFELFILLKNVWEKLFSHLRISKFLNCLFCLNLFKRNTFGFFPFEHLRIVFFG